MLDRLDVIDHPTTRATLDEFVRRIPDPVRVVLSTARPPSGPVAALRAAGRLAEFDEDDLRLDLAETRQLLTAVAGRRVGATEASAVRGDYDGWATGVRLAGVALRDQPPAPACRIRSVRSRTSSGPRSSNASPPGNADCSCTAASWPS